MGLSSKIRRIHTYMQKAKDWLLHFKAESNEADYSFQLIQIWHQQT